MFSNSRSALRCKLNLFLTRNRCVSTVKFTSTVEGLCTDVSYHQKFVAIFPEVLNTIKEEYYRRGVTSDVTDRFAEVIQSITPGGKLLRGLTLVESYALLAPQEISFEENMKLVHMMAWCLEIVFTSILVFDDIIDKCEMRRGRPSWHTVVGKSTALSDMSMMNTVPFVVLKSSVRDKPYYLNLLRIFKKMEYWTALGQSMDMSTSVHFSNTKSFDLFSMTRYRSIAKYKGSHSLFYPGVVIAMHMANMSRFAQNQNVEEFLFEVGILFQVQDDYLDCYGDSERTGKGSTDIREGKCTWLIVTALEKCDSRQRIILQECYGSTESWKIEAVKRVYEELKIAEKYEGYVRDATNRLAQLMQQITTEVPHQVFYNLLNKLHKRDR